MLLRRQVEADAEARRTEYAWLLLPTPRQVNQWGAFVTLTLSQKCGVLFLMGLVLDVLQTIHIQACSSRDVFASVSTLLAIYATGFWGHNWFVEQKSSVARLCLTLAGALGAGLGNAIVILLG